MVFSRQVDSSDYYALEANNDIDQTEDDDVSAERQKIKDIAQNPPLDKVSP